LGSLGKQAFDRPVDIDQFLRRIGSFRRKLALTADRLDRALCA
jgi:hypothetical protein